MQCKQMAECLQQLVPLLGQESAATLLLLADAIRAQGVTAFGSAARKLEKGLKSQNLVAMNTPSSTLLERMATIAEAAGAATMHKDFSAASNLVAVLSGLDPNQVPTVLAAATAPQPKKTKPAKAPQMDAREAADKLTAVSRDPVLFDSFVGELGKYSKDSLGEIAQRYLGYPRQFKSKPEIIKAIRSRQLQDAMDTSREDKGAKLAV